MATTFALLCATGALLSVSVHAFPKHPGSFDFASGSYLASGQAKVFNQTCDSQTLNIAYPTDFGKGPFPIVSFGHGSGGSMPWDLINGVVSLGIVVVAPQGWCGDQWKDMIGAVNASMNNLSLHPALPHVDWDRVGFMGHSSGGYAAVTAAAYAFKMTGMTPMAAVASHGVDIDGSRHVTSPIMYTSGSGDPRRHKSAQGFANCPARPKVFAVLNGGRHMEPEGQGRLNPFDALFMGCHLKAVGSTASCARIYGNTSDALCFANSMTTCQIDLTPPTPPTPSPPSPCDFEQDVDFDMDSKDGVHPAGSKEECCSVCVANSTCAAAVFDPAWRRHPASCWFKTKDQLSKKVSNPGRVACIPKSSIAFV
jgi:hypothetical protein